MSLVWQSFFRQQGVVNQVLAFFGIHGMAWLNNATSAFAVVVLADTWFFLSVLYDRYFGRLAIGAGGRV